MFGITKSNKKSVTTDDIAKLLKKDKSLVNVFEEAYNRVDFSKGLSENLFEINAKQMADLRKSKLKSLTENEVSALVTKVVNELLAQTEVYSYDSKEKKSVVIDYTRVLPESDIVTLQEIEELPKDQRPQFTGYLMKTDIGGSGEHLKEFWEMYVQESNPKKKKSFYDHFRQGLDILDVDAAMYAIIDRNMNSMGNWLPYIVSAVDNEGFFKIPSTKIIKLPITLLQLTRLNYPDLTPTTFDIVDEYCYKAFGLEDTKEYFVKTGTYSSKFDFRNARVSGAKEVSELGEYLLYNHWKALQMAGYDLSGRNSPVIYGVSTTVEWVVREFIPDTEGNLTIYHGLPLRTEYRAFVDFDTKEVLGIHSYWDEKVMLKHFSSVDGIDAKHDYITYQANKDELNARYNKNKDKVCEHLRRVVEKVDMQGQWSVDVMQNGEDFYIIDMAIAENSAYYEECVPVGKRRLSEERWLPLENSENK